MQRLLVVALLLTAACVTADGENEAAWVHGAPDPLHEATRSIERCSLPRDAEFAIAAVQPGGRLVALDELTRDGRVLYRATTDYGDAGRRTVLVDRGGRILERSHEISAEQAARPRFAAARDAITRGLGGEPARWEVVHDDGAEWLRASTADGRVECGLDGRVRRTVRLAPRPAR